MRGKLQGQHSFVDRAADCRAILSFLRAESRPKSRCLLLKCNPGSGITSFLKYIKFVTEEEATAVYVDVAQASNHEIIEQFFIERSRNRFNSFGEWLDWRRVVAVLIKALGALSSQTIWLKPALAAGTEFAHPLIFTPYESQPLERFSRAACTPLGKKSIIFLLDNAQLHFSKIEGLLATTHAPEYSHVRFVVTYAAKEDDDLYAIFRERADSSCHQITEHRFSGVTRELVAALADSRNQALSEVECDNLIRKSGANVWRVTRFIKDKIFDGSDLSSIEKYILTALIVAKQSIKRSDLWVLSATSPLVYIPDENAWEKALRHLAALCLVSIEQEYAIDPRVTLASKSQPMLADISADHFAALPVAQELYDYFNRVEIEGTPRHSLSYTAPLLYQLSLQIDPSRQAIRAQKLVEAALAQGSLKEAERYIKEARNGGAVSIYDHFLQISFYVACLDFEKALTLVESLGEPTIQRHAILRLIRTVSLNRVRDHVNSLQEIDALLSESRISVHEKAILASYKVSGLLHEERDREAASFSLSISRSLRKAKGYAYFLRNSAAAFMWGQDRDLERAESLLYDAAKSMRSLDDKFGEHTVLNNLGVVECYRESYDKALSLFKESYTKLRIYGTHHLEEVGANIGSALLKNKQPSEAKLHLIRYCSITAWDFPRCLAENSLTLAEWILGEKEKSFGRMDSLLERVDALRIQEAGTLTRWNACILLALARNDDCGFQLQFRPINQISLSEMEIHVSEALQSADNGGEAILGHWKTEYCQYWSQNPLALLPGDLLTL